MEFSNLDTTETFI